MPVPLRPVRHRRRPARGRHGLHARARAAAAALLVALLAATPAAAPLASAARPAAAPLASPASPAAVPAGADEAADVPGAGRWRPPVTGTVVRPADLPRSPWGAGHRGIDLDAGAGAPVVAPAAGTVTFAGRVAGRPVVVLAHAGDLRTSLEPVTATVAVGQEVRAGEPLGHLAPGPGHCAPRTCVHWGVRLGERYVDPAALLDRPRVVLMPPRA